MRRLDLKEFFLKENPDDIILVHTKHSLAIRWTHWINSPLLTLMIISGIMIYWANDIYTPLIPDTFYSRFGLDHKLAFGLAIHFFFMWLFLINGLIYTFYLLLSGSWREIVPSLKKKLPAQGKFSGSQQIAYSGILLLGFLQILTGLAIYKPVQLQFLHLFFSDYETARFFHFIITLLFILFIVVHIVQVIRAGWNNFRAMVTGNEEVKHD